MEKIGIVIPYINSEHYVKDLLTTLRTKHPYVVALIDNNSEKSVLDWFNECAAPDGSVALRCDSNIGCAGAWNFGIKTLLGGSDIQNIVVLNNDVLMHPEAIDLLVAKRNETNFPIVSATDVARHCASPQHLFELPVPKKEYITDEPEFSAFVISRDWFNLIGEFDTKFWPAYFEDNDYHYRIRLLKTRAVKLSTAIYYHYGSRTAKDNPEIDANVNTYYMQNEKYYVGKWGGLPGHEVYNTPFNQQKHG